MPTGDFVETGTLPRPLPIARTARLVVGLGLLSLFIWNVIRHARLVDADVPVAGYFVGVGFAFWFFSDIVNLGFSRAWGRWPQAAVFPFALALVVAGLVAYGNAWAPPLAWGVFAFTDFFNVYTGTSFLLAAGLALPR